LTTQNQIKKQRAEIDKEIKRLEWLIEIERAKISALQDQFKYPKMYRYSDCGKLGDYCRGCGCQT
jgi:hypothetical protein